MKKYFDARAIQLAALCLAALMLLVVNREFGVADNGDFSRYVGNIASAPLDLGTDRPLTAAEIHTHRFFSQPLFYWAPATDASQDPWFTSATLFWKVGQLINTYFFSPAVVNLKHIGLPFFLLHLFCLVYVLRRIRPTQASTVLAFLGTVMIFTDARITAFYNSLYAESIPILAVFFVFSFFAGRLLSGPAAPHGRLEQKICAALVLVLLIASVFAKRQYIYFAAPALLFATYVLWVDFNSNKKLKVLLAFGFATSLAIAVFFATVSQRVDNPAEAFAARYTSYHALYYGLLPHSSAPLELMDRLGLPRESKALIGTSAWNEASGKLIAAEPNINLGTFLSAIVADPAAFAGSLLHNASKVGNFEVDLGMVYGAAFQHPPAWISSVASLTTRLPGLLLFSAATICALILLAFPLGGTAERRLSYRVFIAMLLTIVLSDVVISTFDGQQEAAKHVLVASVASTMILIIGIFSLAGRLTRGSPGLPGYPESSID